MPLTKGALAQTVAFLALAGLLADTRRGLPVPSPEPYGRRALDGAEGSDELRARVESWVEARVEAIVAERVDAARVTMRGELEEVA
eukprot:COSAG06_NODE_43524_length_371_cov_0.812500_1_plen_85_part_10